MCSFSTVQRSDPRGLTDELELPCLENLDRTRNSLEGRTASFSPCQYRMCGAV